MDLLFGLAPGIQSRGNQTVAYGIQAGVRYLVGGPPVARVLNLAHMLPSFYCQVKPCSSWWLWLRLLAAPAPPGWGWGVLAAVTRARP